jgi:nitrogen-specific signal transduction histidine kinase/CheY-like chemotaxis protein
VSCTIARDLTDRRQLEDELRQAQKMEAVGQLAGGIAHDFNNLLTAILGYSEFVSDQVQDNPSLSEDVNEIKKAGERASRLTRQLLAFSRKQVLVPQIVDLNQITSEVAKIVGRVIGESIQLEIIAAPSLGHAKVDPGQIDQLLMNLAVNARDAMPKGGRLTIATANAEIDAEFAGRHPGASPGAYVALRVTDTGSGIPPEVLPHIFEPFFTTKPLGKGTGLGLSTVFGIVKQSGGHITIDSRPGAGTTVTSYFPRVNPPAAPKESPARSDRAGEAAETILLVEDDLAVRELARRTLEARGYTVLAARDVADAISLERTHRKPIHLLLSDIVMPEMNGPDLAQRLVRRRPDMQVLYMSGFAHHLAVAPDATSPRTAFLQKPFTPEALALKVGALLARRGDLDGRAVADR